ncbi:MAG TPA: protein kinase [Candidatus Eisenbacteria bacterium]|nr:protein kinase [Candidatus Eisenbacteria bacterium]
MKPDGPDLDGLADEVAKGAPVDWTRIGESRGLAGLKLIEQLSAAYREEVPLGEAPAATVVFEPGERLGPYRIEGELGRGGMGVVYLARDLRLDREVAVKALPPELDSDPESLDRLTREARLLASLDHPGIAVIHGMEEDERGARYLVLERVRGVTLGARLRSGPIPQAEALVLATQIAEALQAAHEGGVIHRDLKPGNIMVTAHGRVKILDFGLARSRSAGRPGGDASEPGAGIPGHSESGIVGTAGYASPERLQGLEDVRADVFAFGAVLYECLAGVVAFPGASAEDVLSAVLTRDPDLSRLPVDLPESVRHLIAGCLEKDPGRRLAGMEPILAVLRRARATGAERAGARVPSSTPNNLPSERTRFVGRGEVIRECEALLESGRLLTLTGAGGAGKTRIALRIAGRALARHPGGVWFVDLSALAEPSRVPLAVAAAMGAREQPGVPLPRTLLERLRDTDTLLVLDNCEHVLEASRTLVMDLHAGCRALTVLATSREALGLESERSYDVPPLPVPGTEESTDPATLMRHESVELFVDRASIAAPDFSLDVTTAPAVARICRTLDGIPLAIELAAARTHVLGAAEIAERLDRMTALLQAAPGTVSRRHATLRAALDWSVDALEPEEQAAFRALSVFAGGWDVEGARAVLDRGDLETVDLLAGLARRSLVAVTKGPAGSRYRYLEPVRQFAAERLARSGEEPAVRARFLSRAAALAERAEPELLGREQAAWLDRIGAEHENLLAALEGSGSGSEEAEAALRIAGSLWRFWHIRGHLRTGAAAVRRALSLPGAAAPTPFRARALYAAGALAAFDMEGQRRAREYFEEALAIFRAAGDDFGAARCLTGLGAVASARREFAEGSARLEEAQVLYRKLGDMRGLAVTLNNLGAAAWNQGDHARAGERIGEALDLARSAGDLGNVAQLGVALSMIRSRSGDAAGAAPPLREALATLGSLGARHSSAAGALLAAGELATLEERFEDAARWFGAADTVLEKLGLVFDDADVWWKRRDACLATVRGALGSGSCDAHGEAGRRMDVEVALRKARDELSDSR